MFPRSILIGQAATSVVCTNKVRNTGTVAAFHVFPPFITLFLFCSPRSQVPLTKWLDFFLIQIMVMMLELEQDTALYGGITGLWFVI